MQLTDTERAMLDGSQGKAKQKAMDLLIRYGEALGAARFVDTTNVAGVPGYYNPVLLDYYKVTADAASLVSLIRRASMLLPRVCQPSASTPPCSAQEFTIMRGTSTTSSLSRSNRE